MAKSYTESLGIDPNATDGTSFVYHRGTGWARAVIPTTTPPSSGGPAPPPPEDPDWFQRSTYYQMTGQEAPKGWTAAMISQGIAAAQASNTRDRQAAEQATWSADPYIAIALADLGVSAQAAFANPDMRLQVEKQASYRYKQDADAAAKGETGEDINRFNAYNAQIKSTYSQRPFRDYSFYATPAAPAKAAPTGPVTSQGPLTETTSTIDRPGTPWKNQYGFGSPGSSPPRHRYPYPDPAADPNAPFAIIPGRGQVTASQWQAWLAQGGDPDQAIYLTPGPW